MKNLIIIVFVVFLVSVLNNKKIFAQWGVGPELLIANKTGSSANEINIKFFPIGAVYNSNFLYSPKIGDGPLFENGFEYLVGFDTTLNSNIAELDIVYGHFDGLGVSSQCVFAYGLGLYKLEFYNIDHTQLLNYCYIDWRDANVYLTPYYTTDLAIEYFNQDSINFYWAVQGSNPHLNIDEVNKYIKLWEFKGSPLNTLDLVPSKGLFSLDSSNNGEFLKIPIYNNLYNGNLGVQNSVDLGMNLVIDYDVTTQDTAFGNGDILVTENGFLKIADGKEFHMNPPLAGHHNLIVQDSSLLVLEAGSKLIVDSLNRLTLKSKGKISLGFNSEIKFEAGSLFCNEGGVITSPQGGTSLIPGKIILETGSHQLNCFQLADIPISAGVKIILKDSAILEIPDSTILHFTGKQSGLVMNPNSKLRMGIGSKVIFDSSASIYADGAEFSSVDSVEKWEGIFLYDSDADTIKNCTFSNAKTALTIINDPDDAESVYENRIITDNTFNIPNGDVHMGIYGENNYRILIQKNDFNMPVYYPSGSPVQLLYAGVYLKNSSSVQPDSGDVETNQETNYSLNIEGNSFSNGCASLILANYTQAICLI